MYFEEAEWCFRAKRKGYQIWYVPTAEVIHLHPPSALEQRAEIFNESMVLFYKRNIGVLRGIIIATFSLFRFLNSSVGK